MDGMGTAVENAAEQAVTENGTGVAEQAAAETAEQASGAEQAAEEKETQEAADPAAEGEKKAEGEEASKEEQKAAEKQKEDADHDAELKEREKSLHEREEALQKKEIEDAAKDLLKENQLPVEKSLLLVQAENKEKTQERVEALRDIVAEAVKAKLDETLRGRTPVGAAGTVISGDKTVADVFSAALRG